MTETLDIKDILLLKMVKNGASIREMAKAIGVSSNNSVHKRLKILITAGYVTPPPKPRMSRSWKLTAQGEQSVAPYVR